MRKTFLVASLLLVLAIILIVILITSMRAKSNLIKAISVIVDATNHLAIGKLEKIDYQREDELSKVVKSLNTLTGRLEVTSDFTKSIGENKFDFDFEIASEYDTLGKSLITTRDKLEEAHKNDSQRKIDDGQRNWAIAGQAKMGDIIRNSQSNVKELVNTILQNLVNYTDCNQGEAPQGEDL